MKNLTMPWAVLVIGVFAVTMWSIMQWPERYYYHSVGENGVATVRINRWTGKNEFAASGYEWESR